MPKKTAHRKQTTKPRKKSGMSEFQKSIYIVLGVFFFLVVLALGYILGGSNDDAIKQSYKTAQEYSIGELLNDLSAIKAKEATAKVNETVSVSRKEIPKQEVVKNEVLKQEIVKQDTVPEHISNKPKLSIIIDDISRKGQLDKVQGLGMQLTPSIFPPSELSMTSHHLAKGLEHFMIHLPMESGNKKLDKQYKTLKTSTSKADIIARAKEIRKLFPKGLYINNHTGSKFVADYNVMRILYEALRTQGFYFMDSRTGAKGKVVKISSEFSDKYVSRDVFIDNEQNVSYTHKQLKKAVEIAKKKGYAIAIGHPHKTTLKALASAKEILKDVDLVYIDAAYKK